ncbi:MAG: hypothetical protein IJE97_03155, partial [Thermoguttaceae bacterium]|nr:hypothetical protein [Thermoguttaceae bacterium]
MEFSPKTKALMEKSFGKSLEEIRQMTLDEEIAFVEKKLGRRLEFPPGINLSKPQPRNTLLSRGRFLVGKKPR